MRGPFKWQRGRFADEDGCVYTSAHYNVSADQRTEKAGGLTRLQAREVCALLNRLDRRGVGRMTTRGAR